MLIKPIIRLTPTHTKHRKLNKADVNRIVVHRLKLGLSILDAVDSFIRGEPGDLEVFGGRFPYHFGIEPNGTCYQLLPLSRAGVHARVWNSSSIAIACFGDFRREAPTCDQWLACARLCRTLEHVFLRADVWGHDELPGGSTDPNKECPGKHWPIAEFLGEVRHTPISGADIVGFERAVVL